jgi:hypothetical protein
LFLSDRVFGDVSPHPAHRWLMLAKVSRASVARLGPPHRWAGEG